MNWIQRWLIKLVALKYKGRITSMLKGYKTYLVAGLAGIAAVLHALGIVDQQTLLVIESVLAPFGLAFLRAGVKDK